jgi:uncharacterized protein YceH (UPF0502 family)
VELTETKQLEENPFNFLAPGCCKRRHKKGEQGAYIGKSDMDDTETKAGPKWQPLNSRQRRLLGVLVEKAKTTPDVYPMTVNGLVTGANQKSNRDPVMTLDSDEVEKVLEELRAVGAVTEVQGTGRTLKYRHQMYEWLGVDKVESAVMTELLLRGEQTLGDLRARASRMEPIADLATLKQIVDSLLAKNLMIELTPPGRGQVVSHNLYKERELPELRAQYANHKGGDSEAPPSSNLPVIDSHSPAPSRPVSSGVVTRDMFAELEVEVAEMRAELARIRERLTKIEGGDESP